MPKPSPIDAELIAHASAGTLVGVLRRATDGDREDSLANRLVAFHNGEQLDLLASTQTPEFDVLVGPIPALVDLEII